MLQSSDAGSSPSHTWDSATPGLDWSHAPPSGYGNASAYGPSANPYVPFYDHYAGTRLAGPSGTVGAPIQIDESAQMHYL